ncbi:hypothetical protein [Burkholderia glumae]|uniref:hypothetical protein n=1 Tax=Burkholderia glumae TaxID=337 RepID=UPI002036DA91|nr:hypothetical protein [Burkholderia glumae]MCM2537995.1 hypothetical protein [Burkholderia glumae]
MFEAYSIAVKISVVNQVSGALMAMSQQFSKLHGQATQLQSRLEKIKLTMLQGGALLGAGAFGLKMFDGAIKSANGYYHQLALLKNVGMSQVEVAQSVQKAWSTTHEVMSTKAGDNIKTLLELRSATLHYDDALAILPTVQRISAVMQSITGAPQEHVGFDMVKGIEFATKSGLTAEGMKAQAEMMSKAIIAMNGTVTAADFHQAFKYSRAAAPYLSDEFKYQYLPTLIQEFKAGKGGASGAGNTIASLFGVIVGRMIPKELISNWVAAGLVNPKMVQNDPHNRTTSKILPGGVVGTAEFAQNPELYAQKYIRPAIEKLQAKYHISELDAYYALTKNRVAAFGLQTLVNKGPQFERDKALINAAPNSSTAYSNLAKTDPELAQMQLDAQWENLKVRLAYDVVPKLLQAFNWLTPKLSELVDLMEKNQGTVTAFVGTFLGLSALAGVAGSILLVKAAVQALSLALSLTGGGGLGMAIGALASPIGIAVVALGTLAAAIYAFRPLSQSEIDSYKTNGGAKLSPSARARVDAGELNGINPVSPLVKHQGGVVHTTINMDGRKFAQAVTPYMAGALGSGMYGMGVDPTVAPPMPGIKGG